jgi:YrhK-like protein
MSVDQRPRVQRRTLEAFVRRFPTVHVALGLAGNTLFVVGSFLFVAGKQDVGAYLFVAGSCGMFIGSLGEAVRGMSRRRLESSRSRPEE